eukprot:4652125-Pyramimonas_sp.AAC.1
MSWGFVAMSWVSDFLRKVAGAWICARTSRPPCLHWVRSANAWSTAARASDGEGHAKGAHQPGH